MPNNAFEESEKSPELEKELNNLRRKNADLERLVALKDLEARRFIHDINNNLQVFTYLEYFKKGKIPMDTIVEKSESMWHSLDQIFGTMSSYQAFLRKESLVGDSVLYNCVNDVFKSMAFNYGLELKNDVPNGFSLRIHPFYLNRMLLNFGKNSLEAIKDVCGGENFEGYYFRVSAEGNDKMVNVYCDDNGPGISDKDKSKIFGDFSTKGPYCNVDRGIGLGCVKSLAEKHKGYVKVRDNPEGKGARFILALPKV